MSVKVEQTSNSGAVTVPASTAGGVKISKLATKTGFLIPKNKLSGLVPRGSKKGKGNPSKEEDDKRVQRKTKWGPDLIQTTAVKKGRALAYQIPMDWSMGAKVEPSSTSGAVVTPVSIPNSVHLPDLATTSQFPNSHNVQFTQNIAQNFFEVTNQNLKKCQKGLKFSPWSVKEDLALMSSWCFASDDKARGNIPKGTSLWARVAELFEHYRAKAPEEINSRNLDQMKGRYKRLNESVTNWIAAYEEAYHMDKNGMSTGDVLTQAHIIYTKGGYNKKFSDTHVFEEIMSKHPKWKINLDCEFKRGGGGSNKEKCNSSKRSRTNEDQDLLCAHPEDEGSNDERQDSSKRSRINEDGKNSIPAVQETSAGEDSAIPREEVAEKKGNIVVSPSDLKELLEEVRESRLARNKEVELSSEFRTEMELKKEERKAMKLKVKLLIKLVGTPHLSQEEQELKSHLISAVMKKL